MSGGGNGSGSGDADDAGDGRADGDDESGGEGTNDEKNGTNGRDGRNAERTGEPGSTNDRDGRWSDATGRPNAGADEPSGRRGNPNDATSGPSGGVERLSRYFDALADERRRHALYYLHQHGTASVGELARYVVVSETGRLPDPSDERSADEYERVKSEFHHKHLPRLADYGLVEFDSRSGQVRFREPTRTFSTLVWLSRLVEGEEVPADERVP